MPDGSHGLDVYTCIYCGFKASVMLMAGFTDGWNASKNNKQHTLPGAKDAPKLPISVAEKISDLIWQSDCGTDSERETACKSIIDLI